MEAGWHLPLSLWVVGELWGGIGGGGGGGEFFFFFWSFFWETFSCCAMNSFFFLCFFVETQFRKTFSACLFPPSPSHSLLPFKTLPLFSPQNPLTNTHLHAPQTQPPATLLPSSPSTSSSSPSKPSSQPPPASRKCCRGPSPRSRNTRSRSFTFRI